MPYTKKARRKLVDAGEASSYLWEPGDWAYYVTTRALEELPKDFRFKHLAAVTGEWLRGIFPGLHHYEDETNGAQFLALLEFYRRLVAKYEDKAIKKNGDIPGYGR